MMPNRDNERMKVQYGAFYIFGLDQERGSEILDKHKVATFIIDKYSKRRILESLSKMSISTATIYPGLERAITYRRGKKLGFMDLGK